MNITYTQNGDYLIPNIIIRKTKPLGHYGRLRKAYLKMHRPILFNELVLSDKIFEHFGNKGQYHIFIDTMLGLTERSARNFGVL